MATLRIKNEDGTWRVIGGLRGNDGVTPDINLEVVQLDSTDAPTVTKTGSKENPVFTIGIPKGEKGDKGDTPTGLVKSVNSKNADESGAVTISASDVGALPTSGGTMMGALRTSSVISKSSDDTFFDIYGGTTHGKGSQLTLFGYNHADKGMFSLTAHDGTSQKSLVGKPDGILQWGGNDIITNGYTNAIVIDRETAHIHKRNANGRTVVRGGTSTAADGASIYLNGTGYSSDAGCFILQARTSDGVAKNFIGNPDGTLSWDGKTLLTTSNSNWTVSNGANGYMRDNATGFTIFWGKGSSITKGKYGDWYTPYTYWATLTYPKTMKTIFHVVPYAVVTSHSVNNIGVQACAKSITTSNFIHGLIFDTESNITAYPAYVGFGIS